MDELLISGKKYISSKRASEITGYAKDYVGQLARGQKIKATQVGRTWYVLEEAILRHKNENSPLTSEFIKSSPPLKTSSKILYSNRQIADIPKTWSPVRYFNDQGEHIPPLIIAQNNVKITLVRTSQEEIVENKNVVGEEIIPITRIKPPAQVHTQVKNIPLAPYIPLVTGAIFVLAVSISFSGVFLGSELRLEANGASQAATAVVGLENFQALFDSGIASILSFYHFILNSFIPFLQTGFNFIAGLLSRLSEVIFR